LSGLSDVDEAVLATLIEHSYRYMKTTNGSEQTWRMASTEDLG
jgi:hypothetical protein